MKQVRLVLAGAVALASLLAAAPLAQADPDAVTKAKAALEQIQEDSSSIDQEIIASHDRAEKAQAKLKTVSADLKTQEAKVAELNSRLGDVAELQLQTDSISLAAQLLLSESSEDFLSGLSTVQAETDRANSAIQELQLDQARLTTLREDASAAEATLEREAAAKVKLGKEYEAKEAEAQQVYDRLSAEERERLAALEAERVRQAEAARVAVQRAAAQTSRSGTERSAQPTATQSSEPAATPEQEPAPAVSATGSAKAQAVVKAALSKVGSGYAYGQSGPNMFDCSGLTSWAYRQVGISLSRVASAQTNDGRRISSASDLQPGDLVFYYRGITHVGLYIGNGQIVDAANPRAGVRVTSVHSMPFQFGARVIG